MDLDCAEVDSSLTGNVFHGEFDAFYCDLGNSQGQILFGFGSEGTKRNNGDYDGLPYEYYSYPKVTRNIREANPKQIGATQLANRFSLSRTPDAQPQHSINEHILGPKRLFMLVNPASQEMEGAAINEIGDWVAYQKQGYRVDFIFVAYTVSQFQGRDFPALHTIAERAARDAGVGAFWVASECLDHNNWEDVGILKLG